LGAASWCAQFGLDQASRADDAACMSEWLTLLRTDTRALLAVCGHAQRAVDHLNAGASWTSGGPRVEAASAPGSIPM
jgi:antirestriction protein ArdC